MITTQEASEAISRAIAAYPAESVSLAAATGRVLQQIVVAERDQPPFDRVTMDGIALRFAALSGGRRQFSIRGTQHAGDAVLALLSDEHCIEIMTGGVLPTGSDCVVPVERIAIEKGMAVIEEGYAATERQFVHPQASDYPAGHAVLRPGRSISPMDIAVIASCGLNSVQVCRQPRISVISTGNELVPPGQPIERHQVRLSNGPALVSMLRQQGFGNAADEHLVDEKSLLKQRIAEILDESQVLVLSGGVSMGKADFVPEVLRDLGVEVVFHKISQRPGKPMWFGIGPQQQAVFALPGNPVSTLVCCRQYVLPALLRASGRDTPRRETAVLAEPITFKPKLTCFQPVCLDSTDDGCASATAVATNTSGDFAALSGTDGYVELDLAQDHFPAGTVVPLHRWNRP